MFGKSVQTNVPKAKNDIPSPNLESRRSFLKLLGAGAGGVLALGAFNKCGYDIAGPAADNFSQYQPNNNPILKINVGDTLTVQDSISVVPLKIRISSISKPDLMTDPREVTLDILNADGSAAWTTSKRAGEITSAFYNPADASSSVRYEIEVKEIPGTPYPDPDWARLTIWEKSAKPA